ncbi:hypothetical protein D3C81_1250930 [compost metagenome]
MSGDEELRAFRGGQLLNQELHLGVAEVVLRFFQEEGMQFALGFMPAQRELGFDEALLTLTSILDRDPILGDDEVGFEIGADTGSYAKLVGTQASIECGQLLIAKGFLPTAIAIFQAVALCWFGV